MLQKNKILKIIFVFVAILLFAKVNESKAQIEDHKGYESYLKSVNNKELFTEIKKIDLINLCEGKNYQNDNCVKLRKLADEMNNRQLKNAGLTNDEKAILKKLVTEYISISKSPDLNDFEEANLQMQRLGQLAVPTLLQHLEHPDKNKADFAANMLIKLRTEEIVQSIISKAKATKDLRQKIKYKYILMMMKNTYKPLVPNRTFMDEATTREVYTRLVEPAIRELDKEIAAMKN